MKEKITHKEIIEHLERAKKDADRLYVKSELESLKRWKINHPRPKHNDKRKSRGEDHEII